MQININLLQEKNQTTKKPLFTILFIILAAMIVLTILIVQIHFKQENVSSLNNQIESIKEERKMIRESSNQTVSLDSYTNLENAISWTDERQVNIVSLLHRITEILTDRGVIQSINLQNEKVVELNIQFDQRSQTAYYLSELNRADWVSEANLISVMSSQSSQVETEGERPSRIYTARYTMNVKNQGTREGDNS